MADEAKQEQQQTKNTSKTLFKYLLGIIFVGLGVGLVFAWFSDLLMVVRGCLGPMLVLAGAITIAIAKD